MRTLYLFNKNYQKNYPIQITLDSQRETADFFIRKTLDCFINKENNIKPTYYFLSFLIMVLYYFGPFFNQNIILWWRILPYGRGEW